MLTWRCLGAKPLLCPWNHLFALIFPLINTIFIGVFYVLCITVLPLYMLRIYSFMYWKSGTSDLLVLMLFVLQCTDYKQNFFTLTLSLLTIKWKRFSRYWPFVRGIHRSPVNSPHRGQWRGALIFSLICASINGWVNNREVGDLRRYRAHYDVNVYI